MKYIVAFFLFAITCSANAQELDDVKRIIPAKRTLGKFADGRPIPGLVFEVVYPIAGYEIDTGRQEILFVLKKQTPYADQNLSKIIGRLALFDLKTNTFKWSRDYKSFSEFSFRMTEDHIIQSFEGRYIVHSRRDGATLWQGRGKIEYLDGSKTIAIDSKGQAFDLEHGNMLWERKIGDNASREKYCNEWASSYLDDNGKLLVAAGGLHYINLDNGSGWSFTPDSNSRQPCNTKAASNIIERNGKIYFASYNKIYCVDTNGKEIWEAAFPEGSGSTSILSFHDRYIFVINKGINTNGDWQGEPFIAGYYTETGERKYFEELNLRQRILKIYNGGAATILLGKDVIYKYNLYNGEKILEKQLKHTAIPEYSYLLYPGAFLMKDSNEFYFFPENIFEQYFLYRPSDGSIVSTDERLNEVDTIPNKKWWIIYNKYRDVSFINPISNTSFVIKGRKQIAQLDMGIVDVVGDKFINISGHEFKIIDARQLVN